ncbi:MAG: DUF1700 domain-containing protein [Bdellovibrionales bacterium]
MTKAEYLRELEGRIRGLPAAERREVLADYEEHFRQGLADGKSEPEICATLGAPKTVAQEILVHTWVNEAEQSQTLASRSGALLQILLLVLILAPFNFFMLICPFLVMFALVCAGWTVPVALAISAVVVMIAVIPVALVLGPFTSLSLMFAGIGTVGLAVLSGFLMVAVTRGLLWMLVSYCKWNVNFIKARQG